MNDELIEPRNTRKHTEARDNNFQCFLCFPWLKNNSTFSTQHSSLALGVWEIQR